MRKSSRPLIIVSRRSPLARAQTQQITNQLAALDPTVRIEHRWIESDADQRPDQPLTQVGGKGLFVKALEQTLLDGTADLAVHSVKDMPAESTHGLVIAAIAKRADERDCLISAAGYPNIQALPSGATVGTSSPRRAAQLLALRPDLQIQLLRGNIDTRLRRVLEEKAFDATLLAIAGLERAGLSQHARVPLDLSDMLPSAGQGALALQCRNDDHVTLLRCLPINDPTSATAVHAERQLLGLLQGDCHSPIAALVQMIPLSPELAALPPAKLARDYPQYRLRARVLSPDGKSRREVDLTSSARHLGKLVKQAAKQLVNQ